ncbi:branched-chain amino acid aminotransferase [Ruminococcaceae bacterium YRB3002]|nr:branched-chain amino acid aminotransferase [Ruminococcaceae bacterium YRB3002]
MQFPVIDCPLGDRYYLNGEIIRSDDDRALLLLRPNDAVKYYETVRIREGVLLFIEDHLARLVKSVKGIEDFPVDPDFIASEAKQYLKDIGFKEEGNLRIVLTREDLVMHICEGNIPSSEDFSKGISTNILQWVRVDPNLKVFRGDYKSAVAECFGREGEHGLPYEVLLTNNDNKIYEGSKSNFFAVIGDSVYSAPDSDILIGITRNRVIQALESAGTSLKYGTFTVEELHGKKAALFVSSTPFDILPVTYVEGYEFDSADNEILTQISREYRRLTDEYIRSNK